MSRRKSFLFVNEYEGQKRDCIELLSTFVRSLDELTGSELTEEMMETERVDPAAAARMVKAVREKGQ